MNARFVATTLAVLVLVAGLPSTAEEMGRFRLVLFVDGVPEFELSDHRIERLSTSHDLWMDNLTQDGVALISGAVEGAAPLRHVAIFDVGSEAEVRRVLENDAAVRLRMLDIETHTLLAQAGILRKPERNAKKTVALIGLFRRPSDAPEFTDDELAEIQAGHLANIRDMVETGDLVLAGPVEGEDELRGILIFRARNPSEVRKLVERDPAIKQRRLELELYRWEVPRGSFPRRAARNGGQG